MSPLVSICIPTYNQPDKLIYLLDSIRSQTFTSFEVLVSDDSNNDSVEHLCRKYEDLNIRYIRNAPAKGTPENWNYAISQAKGTWIKIMHHDDYFYSESSLKKFVAYSNQHPEVEFIYCLTSILNHPSNRRAPYKIDTHILNAIVRIPAYLFHINVIGSPSVSFFRKADFESFNKNLKWLVDIEYYHRMILSKNVGRIDEMLVETIASESQLTRHMQGNPEFELTEFFYCYNTFYSNADRINRKILNMRMFNLIWLYDIKNKNELNRFAQGIQVPKVLRFYFYLRIINARIANSLAYRLHKFDVKAV
jgi:glycosyltransferase involved in cell wall biosynthesis